MVKNHYHRRTVGLGIDVGGTFSDSVLIDLHASQVLSKAKSITSHEDLVKGIERSVGLLDRNLFSHVRLVSLSTTLATNALVEGRKSRIAAILPGYKSSLCPSEFLQDIHLVKGGHTAEGDEMAALDLKAVRRVIESTRETVEAYAVSSYFSTRNPAHELAIQKLIRRLAPQIPIVAGHELSQKLNARHRATTTILNAHLIPLIRGLLLSVKKVLNGFCIDAPLMVVKGDGSLFGEEICERRPVETILSGPAASVVGAGFLMGHDLEKAVVTDIGGTTTDIAVLQDGYPRLNMSGVTIGPWQTHVTAVDVRTIGLGGDSHIRPDPKGEIRIGPKRVEPLCFLAKRFPNVLLQLKAAFSQPSKDTRFTPSAFWFRTNKKAPGRLDSREKKILKVLSKAPLNIFEIARELDTYPITLGGNLSRLEDQALIGMSGFTPTDIFHIQNLYNAGNRESSLLAAQFLARQTEMPLDTFMLKVEENFNRKAALEIIDSLSSYPVSYGHLEQTCPACQRIWQNCFWGLGHDKRKAEIGPFRMQLSLDIPLVAIGAPAHIMAPSLAKRMAAGEFIPKHAEVANALGAIVGTIFIKEQVLIRPLPSDGFVCFTSAGKSNCSTLEDAVNQARRFLTDQLQAEVRRAGGNNLKINIWEDRKQATLASGQKIMIEIGLYGQAVAKPGFQAKSGETTTE
jgi:N-methylhydantoinase A/oxoprolinase/acetone carboxylase beta subunit